MNSADPSCDFLLLDTIRELREQVKALEAWKAEAMEVLLDAAAHLAAASSAYDKFAARHKDLKPRAVADPMFTTRNSDFIKAASRVSSAARRLVEKEDGRAS